MASKFSVALLSSTGTLAFLLAATTSISSAYATPPLTENCEEGTCRYSPSEETPTMSVDESGEPDSGSEGGTGSGPDSDSESDTNSEGANPT